MYHKEIQKGVYISYMFMLKKNIHPRNLTWIPKMAIFQRRRDPPFPKKHHLLGIHVSFCGCRYTYSSYIHICLIYSYVYSTPSRAPSEWRQKWWENEAKSPLPLVKIRYSNSVCQLRNFKGPLKIDGLEDGFCSFENRRWHLKKNRKGGSSGLVA